MLESLTLITTLMKVECSLSIKVGDLIPKIEVVGIIATEVEAATIIGIISLKKALSNNHNALMSTILRNITKLRIS